MNLLFQVRAACLGILLVTSFTGSPVEAFSPSIASIPTGCILPSPAIITLYSQAERDQAIAEYLQAEQEETVESLLQLEANKELQIESLKLQLYQDFNSALQAKELEALRLKLSNLQEQLETKTQVNANANALQDLRFRVQQLLKASSGINTKAQKQTPRPPSSPPPSPPPTKPEKRTGGRFRLSSVPRNSKGEGPPPTKKSKSLSKAKQEDLVKPSTIKLGPFTQKN